MRKIMDYGIDRLESADNSLVLFRGIVGIRAYGTQNANSDTDVRGIFVVPSDCDRAAVDALLAAVMKEAGVA